MNNYKVDIFKDTDDISALINLLNLYKNDIDEESVTVEQADRLKKAIEVKQIEFFVIKNEEEIVGMCSVTIGFSTFDFSKMGVFEDFFIKKDYRQKGLASKLVSYVFEEMKKRQVNSVWVGCSDCDIEMYKHLGFNIKLGNLYTWSNI